jgi:hypothetical protein
MSRIGDALGLLGGLRSRLRPPEEAVRDFLGVVELDTDSLMGVLVLPEHVTAILRVSGTDYSYVDGEGRREIVARWADLLNSAGISVQVFIDRRPLIWDLPGGFLDTMRREVEADLRGEWQHRRYQKMEEAILRGELDSFPAMELSQYVVLRYGLGTAENHRLGREGSMYIPPRHGIRFWERPKTLFGGEEGLAAWRSRRDEAIRQLAEAVDRFLRNVGTVPGLSAEPCSGLEVAQLLHLLWRGERALDEWLIDEAALGAIRSGATSAEWLATPSGSRPAEHIDLRRHDEEAH